MLVTGILKAVDTQAADASPLAGAAILLVLPLPLAVSVVWGWTTVKVVPFGAVLYAAGAAVGLALLLDPGAVLWQIAANGAAGLVARFTGEQVHVYDPQSADSLADQRKMKKRDESDPG